MSSSGKGLGSPLGKKIMGYAYGIGASIVIVGALFKILHLPGAALMLTLGMGTEALLFFLGSFEPPHQEATSWDWSKVYPTLTPEKSPAELLSESKQAKKGGKISKESPKENTVAPTPQAPVITNTTNTVQNTVSMGLSDEDLGKWNDSIKKISNTADNLSKLSEVGNVSESYISKLSTAGDSIEQLSKAQDASAELLSSSTEQLAGTYKTSSEKFDSSISTAAEKLKTSIEEAGNTVKSNIQSASETAASTLAATTNSISEAYTESATAMSKASSTLTDSYLQVTTTLNQKIKSIEGNTEDAGNTLQSVSKNLTAINAVYELQLKSINEELKIKETHITAQSGMNEQLSLIQKALAEAATANSAYNDESKKLKSNIAELNNVYGNMLSSLNS